MLWQQYIIHTKSKSYQTSSPIALFCVRFYCSPNNFASSIVFCISSSATICSSDDILKGIENIASLAIVISSTSLSNVL